MKGGRIYQSGVAIRGANDGGPKDIVDDDVIHKNGTDIYIFGGNDDAGGIENVGDVRGDEDDVCDKKNDVSDDDANGSKNVKKMD